MNDPAPLPPQSSSTSGAASATQAGAGEIPSTGLTLEAGIPICQTDLPLDWYQAEMKPYAEEYLALPDRTPETVLPWLDKYALPALDHFGDELLLLAHFYMGGEIVKLVERYHGSVSDSYVLALQARNNPEKRVIVESAVHFMAETVAVLSHPHQEIWITNPKAGCTMEMLAKDYMVEPIADQLLERYGDDLLCVAYMNTSGRIKALAGRTGGAVCTSSNAHHIVEWAREQGKKLFFVPDQHLGRNVADRLDMDQSKLLALPNPQTHGANYTLADVDGGLDALDNSEMILWGSYCGVHTVFKPEMCEYWRERGYRVLVHPESPLETVRAADGAGSTNFLWGAVMDAQAGDKIAIGTEGQFVRNAKAEGAKKGVEIVHLAEVPGSMAAGCGCATMSRNDPPHLAGMLDLLRQGKGPDANRVLAGDSVNETTGKRDRLKDDERAELVVQARAALERMIEVTESRS